MKSFGATDLSSGPADIRAFAEQLLFGSALDDKLVRPALNPDGSLGDERPGPSLKTPSAPGRSSVLEFRAAKGAERDGFRAGDESETGRGLVMHHFANHELLALELMALVLLRFPEAPASMRQGLVRLITEEQTHLSLYLERMRALGVEFGQFALNDFFWRLMADLDLPAFVAAMNLTFEQANLDHALYYRDVYARQGDDETAAVLERVLADEIGHVKGGLHWLREFAAPDESDWSVYRRFLPANISPVRARGRRFYRAPRLAAGLDADYVDRLEVFADSKGHPARIFYFDPTCEEAAGAASAHYVEPAFAGRLRADLACLPAILASREDIVLVEERVNADFTRDLARAGLEVPRFVERDRLAEIDEPISALHPWGWSPVNRRLFESKFDRIAKEPGELVRTLQNEFPAALRDLYSKTRGVKLLREVLADESIAADFRELLGPAESFEPAARDAGGVVGLVVSSIEEIRTALEAGAGRGESFVIKSPFSAAGRRRIFARERLDERQLNWARKQLERFGELVVEGWLERVLDLSVQGEVTVDGVFVSHGVTRFVTDARGAYLATFVGDPYGDLPRELRRFLDGSGAKERSVFALLERTGVVAAGRLLGAGYRGPFSVDALVYRAGDEFRVKPVVELNPRYSMGRLARALGKHVWFGQPAIFTLFGRGALKRTGHADFRELHEELRREFPVRTRASGTVDLITAGYLPFGDPTRARECLPLLWVGERGERPPSFLIGEP